MIITTIIKNKYWTHKACAKRRGIPFSLTLEEWVSIWDNSGKWQLRGSGKGKFCMSRIGDTGGYEIGNVFIQEFEKNASEANKGRIITEREKALISKKLKGRTFSPETIEKQRQSQLGKKHTPERIAKRVDSFLKNLANRKQGATS